MDIVTLGAALNGSAEYVNSHFKGGSNIQIVDNPDGTQTINASGEVSAEDTVARAEIAAIKDGETLDSFGDVETALVAKANTSTTYTKTEVDTALDDKVDKETGKGLSTNDYTTAEKTKLDDLANIQSIGDGLSLDNGELSAIGEELVKTKIVNSINTASPSSSEPKGTVLNLWSIDPANETLILNKVAFENSIKETGVYAPDTWIPKTWGGLTIFNSIYIWTDGENVYYSDGSKQYVLDKATSTWNVKTWNGLTPRGNNIWTDGEDIYYSEATYQYVLDKDTSTWNIKTWSGLTNFSTSSIWTDGDNIYYSAGSKQYVLDKATSTWNAKTWSGSAAQPQGSMVWADGENVYYSWAPTHCVLDKSTSTWNTKTWNGFKNFDGDHVWTDGANVYCSHGSDQYVLDRSTSTWSTKTWNGLTDFNGSEIWTDGDNVYYSVGTNQYVLK